MASQTRFVFNPRFEREVLREPGMGQTLDRAGEIVEAGAKQRAAVSPDGSHGRPPGYMRDHISHELGEDEQGPYVDIAATATTPDGFPYPLAVELGSKPHVIESHGDYPLRDQHGNVFGKRVEHPGTEPQPFLRPALDDLRGADL